MCASNGIEKEEKTVRKRKEKEQKEIPVLPQSELWTIHGKRYDLRSFVARHPGGTFAIEMAKGAEDSTELFESYHPFTERHRQILARYEYHGSTAHLKVPPDATFEWEKTPVWNDFKAAVRTYFSPRGNESIREVQRNSKATWAAWLQHSFGLCLVAVAFWRWCLGDKLAIIYFPVIYWVVCSDLMHNGSHFAMSTTPWINIFSTYLGSLHVQFHLWNVHHVIGHHVFTNMIGADPDMHHFAHEREGEEMIPGYRSCYKQAYLPKYEKHWKFAVVLQAFATTLAVALLNIPEWIKERAVCHCSEVPERYIKYIKFDRAIVVLGCLVFLWFHGLPVGLFTIWWSWCIHGFLFNVFSQISHVNEMCFDQSESYKEKMGLQKNEWVVHQMLSAADYSCDSKLWSALSINLNSQICHHMFPSVHPCHYPAIRRLLIPVAAKHGLDYKGRSDGTFCSALWLYLRWLLQLNEKTDEDANTFWVSTSTKWGMFDGAVTLFFTLVVPVALLF